MLTGSGVGAVRATHPELGEWLLRVDASAALLFCENETNNERLFGAPNASPYVKDGVNECVVNGVSEAVNPDRTGTKVAAHHVLELAPGASASIRVRLTASGAARIGRRWALGSTAFSVRGDRRPTSSTRRSFRRRLTPTRRW